MENTNIEPIVDNVDIDSEETITNVVYEADEVEVVESEAEKVSVVDPEPKAEPKYKAWEKVEKEQTTTTAKLESQVIPYDRFKAVNDEKNTYLARAMELEKKLADIENRTKELNTIKMPEDIKIEDYTEDTMDQYLKDLVLSSKNQAIKEVEERNIARDQQRIIDEHRQAIISTSEQRIVESIALNPEIKQAVDYFDSLLAPGSNYKLDEELAHELLIDENIGELIYDICTDEKLLNELFSANPKDMIRKIHKMSARIDKATRYEDSEAKASKPETIAVEPLKPILVKKSFGPNIKTDIGARLNPENMSTREYVKYMRNGYKL